MQTRNLGELFEEAKRKYPIKHQKNKKRKVKNKPKPPKQSRSGIKGLLKKLDNNYKQGYCYIYTQYKNGNKTTVQRKDLRVLYDIVKAKEIKLKIVDIKKARKFIYDNATTEADYRYLFEEIILKGDE